MSGDESLLKDKHILAVDDEKDISECADLAIADRKSVGLF